MRHRKTNATAPVLDSTLLFAREAKGKRANLLPLGVLSFSANGFDVMDVASPSCQQEASTSGPPLQQQVGGEVYDQRDHDQVSEQVQQAGHSVLLAEERASCPVHVELRTPEIIDGNHYPSGQRLVEPSSAVVTQAPDGPQQQRRSG